MTQASTASGERFSQSRLAVFLAIAILTLAACTPIDDGDTGATGDTGDTESSNVAALNTAARKLTEALEIGDYRLPRRRR